MNIPGTFPHLKKHVLVACIVALFALPASAAEFNWRIQSNLNAGSPGYSAIESFANVASKMSGGRITFKVYPVDTLFPISSGLDAVGSGITQMAVLTGGYYTGKLGPIATLESGVPGALHTPLERFDFFYKRGFIKIARKAYAPYGVYYLGPQISSSWDIMSTVPINSMDDFKGLKIRAYGLEAEWYKKMGASPIFLSGGELYTALATNVIDAARWASPAGNYNASLNEVAKYYVQPSPMPVPNNFFAVNMDAWNQLPDDLKAILKQAAIASSLDYLTTALNKDAVAMQKMKEDGVKITRIPQDQWEIMEAEAREIWQGYAEEGKLTAQAVNMLNEFLQDLGRMD